MDPQNLAFCGAFVWQLATTLKLAGEFGSHFFWIQIYEVIQQVSEKVAWSCDAKAATH